MKGLALYLCALCCLAINISFVAASEQSTSQQNSPSPDSTTSFGSKDDWKYINNQFLLLEIGSNMEANSKKGKEIINNIGSMLNNENEAIWSVIATRTFGESMLLLTYQNWLIQLSLSINESDRTVYYKNLEEILRFSKSHLDNNIDALLNIYSKIENKNILLQIDKSRDIMKQSATQLKESIGIVEFLYKYCETTTPENRAKLTNSRK